MLKEQIAELLENAKLLRDRVAETRGQLSSAAQSKLATAVDKLDEAVAETEDALAEEADATDTTEPEGA